MILDIYSRAIVGFEVHATDSADHAARLAKRTAALADGVHAAPLKPVLHGDIKPSCSRQRVSDDNPYAETLFHTAKYRPEFPVKGFADLDAAQEWAVRFVHRYNEEHSHSAILYVTPAQRHAGQDRACSPHAMKSIQRARQNAPRRWSSSSTRDWTPVEAATLNQERDTVVQAVITRPTGEPVSRPDLATPRPWRAAKGKRAAEPPGATHSAPFRASMAMMASTGPSPKVSAMAHSTPIGGPGHRDRGNRPGGTI